MAKENRKALADALEQARAVERALQEQENRKDADEMDRRVERLVEVYETREPDSR